MNKRSIIAIAVAVLVCLPCILIMDGNVDNNGAEHLSLTNIIGTAWLAFLVMGGFRLLTPKWMRDELSAYMGED